MEEEGMVWKQGCVQTRKRTGKQKEEAGIFFKKEKRVRPKLRLETERSRPGHFCCLLSMIRL